MQLDDNQTKLLKELASPQTRVSCDDHSYFPGSKLSRPPVLGCKYCCMADIFFTLAQTPPDKRLERLDQMEAMIHHAAEAERAGELTDDFFANPEVVITKTED